MIHIGKEIEKAIRNQGKSVTWFAAQLDCTRVTVAQAIFSGDKQKH
jgi:hypothetical protein